MEVMHESTDVQGSHEDGGLACDSARASAAKDAVARAIGAQLLRSGTAVGANYRAACRERSSADVIAKLKIVEEEADESMYWMELLIEAEIITVNRLQPLMKEMSEILAMVVASIKTLRSRQQSATRRNRQSSIVNRQSEN